MVSLPGLINYSETQKSQARQTSAAFARYETLLAEKDAAAVDLPHFQRHRAWLECVLATYFGTASDADICAYWSQTADILLKKVWLECGLGEFRATLFALGKHGSRELNLSSDIDLVVVAEPEDVILVEKGLRQFIQTLQQPGPFGFCYRLDFDLRPGGKLGPWITTPSQFQDYYWSQGETWERLALVRLRMVAGSTDLALNVADLAKRFVFRKFLDFTLLEDLKALRSKVHKSGFDRRDGELHLKLEVGGIRDIELFVHSLLIIHGGKLPELQTSSTSLALELLADRKILPREDCDFFLNTYWYYRHVENYVQSVEDRQTHVLSLSLSARIHELPKISDLLPLFQRVDTMVSSLLGQVNLRGPSLPAEPDLQKAWLHGLGLRGEEIEATWQKLIQYTALSHRNDRDEEARQEFLVRFVTELARYRNPAKGLSTLADFVRATRAKATFFSLLNRTPRLIQDLARIFSLSPYLGSILAARPELLDHFILQMDEAWSMKLEEATEQMSERKLLSEIWTANQFLSDKNLADLSERMTTTADEICSHLLACLKEEFKSCRLEVLTLGKWGGKELGLHSDLDFIFLSENAATEDDFKVARRFISRLTDSHKGGQLFDVDLRLRPSGRSGPLLVTRDSLCEYWKNQAQPWEKQAYLRARPLDPSSVLPKDLLFQKPLSAEELEELKTIRIKLLKPLQSEPTQLDLKYFFGGLLDIELVTQTALLCQPKTCESTATLQMIDWLANANPSWQNHAPTLREIYVKLRTWEQFLQLSATHKLKGFAKEDVVFESAAHLLNHDSETGWTEILTLLRNSRAILNDLDPTGIKI